MAEAEWGFIRMADGDGDGGMVNQKETCAFYFLVLDRFRLAVSWLHFVEGTRQGTCPALARPTALRSRPALHALLETRVIAFKPFGESERCEMFEIS
jgi:hypothetical protein